MSCLGNILWMIFGGFVQALGWLLAGLLWCISIVGIPFGLQCFKMASLQLAPFGKKIESDPTVRITGTIGNIIWLLTCGWELALGNLLAALIFAISIIGIPFAKQSMKLAALSLAPFGKRII